MASLLELLDGLDAEGLVELLELLDGLDAEGLVELLELLDGPDAELLDGLVSLLVLGELWAKAPVAAPTARAATAQSVVMLRIWKSSFAPQRPDNQRGRNKVLVRRGKARPAATTGAAPTGHWP